MRIEKFSAAPNEEVYGPASAALFNNINIEDIRPLLEKHNITEAVMSDWLPLQRLMDLYQDMENQNNISQNYVALGIQTIDTIPYPPEVDTPEKALKFLEESYQIAHRNYRPGEGTKVIFTGPNQAVIIFNAPYPDDIEYGYVWGTLRRFLPAGTHFTLQYMEPEAVGVTDPGTVMLAEW